MSSDKLAMTFMVKHYDDFEVKYSTVLLSLPPLVVYIPVCKLRVLVDKS
jgi:hypothetical protein